MKSYTVAEIKEAVRVALDENNSGAPLASLGDIDTLTLDEIIESKIEDAARQVLERAAHWLLGKGKLLSGSVFWESQPGYGAGHINLPADFLRLLTFKMSDWSHPVIDAITEDDPLYQLQSSRYGGIRGNVQRPVVAVTHRANGLSLEFFSCDTGPSVEVESAKYIPVPKIDDDGYISFSEQLYRPIVYRVASMAASTIGEGETAASLLKTSNELSGITEQ